AGLLGGFAAVGAGYSTALVPTSLDALFAGITTAVMETLQGIAYSPVNPISNYYFNIAAALVLGLLCGLIIDKLLEPRLVRQGVTTEQVEDEAGTSAEEDGEEEPQAELSTVEGKALRYALLAGVLFTVVLLVAVLLPG